MTESSEEMVQEEGRRWSAEFKACEKAEIWERQERVNGIDLQVPKEHGYKIPGTRDLPLW